MAQNLVHISVSEAERDAIEKKLAALPGGAKKAMVSAINDTLRHARTNITRLIADKVYLKQKDIRDNVKIRQKATKDVPEGIIEIKYEAEPLIHFKVRFSKRSGATASIIKGDPVQKFKHDFKAEVASGHVGAFYDDLSQPKRRAQSGRYAGRTIKRGPRKGQPILRRPIKQAYGPAVTTVLEKNPSLPREALADINEFLKKRLDSKIQYLLSKANPDGRVD